MLDNLRPFMHDDFYQTIVELAKKKYTIKSPFETVSRVKSIDEWINRVLTNEYRNFNKEQYDYELWNDLFNSNQEN